MKRIYNITKGQLFCVQIFFLSIWIWALNEADYGKYMALAQPLIFILPFITIFYTLGWKDNKKTRRYQ